MEALRMFRLSTLLILLLMCAIFSAPRSLFAKTGTTSAQVLEIGPDARAAAMGGAYTALSDNANSVFYNPAGLVHVSGFEIPLTSGDLFGGVRQQFFGFAASLRDVRAENVADFGTIAFGCTLLDLGSLPGRDAAGVATNQFSADNSVMFLSYGRAVFKDEYAGMLSAGVTAKFTEEKIESVNAKSQAFDAGILWDNPGRTVSLGATLQNMGKQITYVDESYDLPLYFRAGGALRMLNNDFVVSAEAAQPKDGATGYLLGAEYWLVKTIAFRAGYDSRTDLGTGLSAGIGISLRQLNVYFLFAREVTFDYAFMQGKDTESIHRISLVMKLGAD